MSFSIKYGILLQRISNRHKYDNQVVNRITTTLLHLIKWRPRSPLMHLFLSHYFYQQLFTDPCVDKKSFYHILLVRAFNEPFFGVNLMQTVFFYLFWILHLISKTSHANFSVWQTNFIYEVMIFITWQMNTTPHNFHKSVEKYTYIHSHPSIGSQKKLIAKIWKWVEAFLLFEFLDH